MRLPIRNACVARGHYTSGSAAIVYTVPAGYVLLLKHLIVTPNGYDAWDMQVVIRSADASVGVFLVQESHTYPPSFEWAGWIALNEGDTVRFPPQAQSFDYWFSGALLPWFPAPPLAAVAGQAPYVDPTFPPGSTT
jgi:hypothetical protein